MSNCCSLKNLKKLYISSLGSTIWFTLVLFSFGFTTVSHSILLGNLTNFFISMIRMWGRKNYKTSLKIELEIIGQVLIIFGILLIFSDTFTMDKI